jgi:hypothetical protein
METAKRRSRVEGQVSENDRLPLWVLRVGLAVYRRLPLYPNKQTSLPCVGMSQMCQDRKSSHAEI